MNVLVIIPAYNEEQNIGRVLDDLREHAPDADVVVIDDGYSDGTAWLAGGRGARVLSMRYNLGIGATMQAGYLYASRHGYEVAVPFDGDGFISQLTERSNRLAQEVALLKSEIERGAETGPSAG
ncbi:MAG: glycosyltransferase [Deferrisomatales bacterium]|nr:glycosyltransferase [Deferrisomatales bacterium]